MPDISRPLVLLCEGYAPDLAVEVAYVRQGAKVCFLKGDRKLCLNESEAVPSGCTLVESIDQLELVEREVGGKIVKVVKDGRWIVEGPFQRSDVKNANKRIYGRKIWERLVADPKSPVQKSVAERSMLGHLEHPKDGRTDANEGALLTTKVDLRSDGVVWGVAELLDTPKGLILQEYTRKGVRWGVSSRGNGSVDETGRVNEDDYMLEAWDGVMRPSTPGAYPAPAGTHPEGRTSAAESVDPAPAEPITESEDARALRAEVTTLCETEVSGGSLDRLALTRNLVTALGRVNDASKATALPEKDAADLQDWLMRKLRDVCHSAEVEASITESTDPPALPEGADEAQAAFLRVVRSLQSRLNVATEENATLRTEAALLRRAKTAVESAAKLQLAQAQAECVAVRTAAEAARSDLAAAAKAATAQVAEVQQRLAQRERELALAVAHVSEVHRVEVRDTVDEAVTAALTAHPALAEFESLLRHAPEAAQVTRLVERLVTPATAPTSSVPLKRRALPVGLVVESESGACSATPSAATSPGARIAAGALKAMADRAV